MQDHVVTDGHIVADKERMGIVRDMQHAEILNVGPVADTDQVDVAADHGVKPGAGVLAHDDIPDDDGRVLDEAGNGNARSDALKHSDHRSNLG
ncbi:MAG: hypothetical protein K0S45_995 [Nitrospira sp.]|nr:hypothetical protein [Nitrospira sp.]